MFFGSICESSDLAYYLGKLQNAAGGNAYS